MLSFDRCEPGLSNSKIHRMLASILLSEASATALVVLLLIPDGTDESAERRVQVS